MLIACLILCLFTLNTIFSVLTLWHSYPHSHPDIGSKETHYLLKNGHILLRKVQLKLNFQDEGHLYVNCFFYILFLFVLNAFFLSSIAVHTYEHFHPNRSSKKTHWQLKNWSPSAKSSTLDA